MESAADNTGTRLDSLPTPIDELIEKVRKPFQRCHSDKSPFEELVLVISRSLRKEVGKIKKEAEYVIIAKLVHQLRTTELKDHNDDESRLLKEAQEFLDTRDGRKWIQNWFTKVEPANGSTRAPATKSGKDPAHPPRSTVVDTASLSVSDNAPVVISKQVNRSSGKDFLEPPAPSDSHGIRAASRANIGIDSMAHRSGAWPVRRSSASFSRIRRASEGSVNPERRCAVCGQHHCPGSMLLSLQLLNPPIGSVHSVVNREHRIDTPIIIVQDGYQVSLQVREIRKDGGYLITILQFVFLVLPFCLVVFWLGSTRV